jgi:hypothetical protein
MMHDLRKELGLGHGVLESLLIGPGLLDNIMDRSSIEHCLERFDRDAGRWGQDIALIESYESPVPRKQRKSIANSFGPLKALMLKQLGLRTVGESIVDSVVSAIEIEKSCCAPLGTVVDSA